MMSETLQLTVYFDFLCPFAYRAGLWLNQVQQQSDYHLTIIWKYFPLEQVNSPTNSSWKLWEQDEHYVNPHGGKSGSRALLAFWGAEAARQQGHAEFERFRLGLFHARHEENLDISQRAHIEQIAIRTNLDINRFTTDFTNRDLLDAIRHDYEEGKAMYNVFGVPTLCYDEHNAIYLKLGRVPPLEDAVSFFNELHYSITTRRWLSEIKRPNP